MSEAFAHQASVELAPGSDPRALGAAVTEALCGAFDHEPQCPLAPHYSSTDNLDGQVRLRVLFVAAPGSQSTVRSLIDAALEKGSMRTPHGSAEWTLIDSAASPVKPEELAHARRLMSDFST